MLGLRELGSQCHTAYFSIRKPPFVLQIMEEIKGLGPAQSELVEPVHLRFQSAMGVA